MFIKIRELLPTIKEYIYLKKIFGSPIWFKEYSLIKGYWSPLNPKLYRSLIGSLKGTLLDSLTGKPKESSGPDCFLPASSEPDMPGGEKLEGLGVQG